MNSMSTVSLNLDTEELNPWELSELEAEEAEGALDWVKSIGTGAVTGAATGTVAGPWGALAGGVIGAGLGAVSQARADRQSRPAPKRPPRPARPPLPPPQRPRPPAQRQRPQPSSNRPARPPRRRPGRRRPSTGRASPRRQSNRSGSQDKLNSLLPLLTQVVTLLASRAAQGEQTFQAHEHDHHGHHHTAPQQHWLENDDEMLNLEAAHAEFSKALFTPHTELEFVDEETLRADDGSQAEYSSGELDTEQDDWLEDEDDPEDQEFADDPLISDLSEDWQDEESFDAGSEFHDLIVRSDEQEHEDDMALHGEDLWSSENRFENDEEDTGEVF